MRKLLAIIGAISLTTGGASAVTACDDHQVQATISLQGLTLSLRQVDNHKVSFSQLSNTLIDDFITNNLNHLNANYESDINATITLNKVPITQDVWNNLAQNSTFTVSFSAKSTSKILTGHTGTFTLTINQESTALDLSSFVFHTTLANNKEIGFAGLSDQLITFLLDDNQYDSVNRDEIKTTILIGGQPATSATWSALKIGDDFTIAFFASHNATTVQGKTAAFKLTITDKIDISIPPFINVQQRDDATQVNFMNAVLFNFYVGDKEWWKNIDYGIFQNQFDEQAYVKDSNGNYTVSIIKQGWDDLKPGDTFLSKFVTIPNSDYFMGTKTAIVTVTT